MEIGLFPGKERDAILELLERALVFLTFDNIESVLRKQSFLRSAWDLANLYLGSLDCPGLDGEPTYLVGLSQETSCFVSIRYFDEDDPFEDFVVHEMAHIFHNWKRARVGLPHTRYREWLLQIDFARRETFAYACEVYSRILEQAKTRADRRRHHGEFADSPGFSGSQVPHDELVDILEEAVEARNGWKRILNQCAAPKRVPWRFGEQRSLE